MLAKKIKGITGNTKQFNGGSDNIAGGREPANVVKAVDFWLNTLESQWRGGEFGISCERTPNKSPTKSPETKGSPLDVRVGPKPPRKYSLGGDTAAEDVIS